jgi:hypothetical protein
MESKRPTKEDFERLNARRGEPIDLTDTDCPPADFVNMKWHRGLPTFLENKKINEVFRSREPVS